MERRPFSPRSPRWIERNPPTKRAMQRGYFTETEFDQFLRCTAPWKACGVDSIYSFPIKKCPPIKKAVFQLVKRVVEWRVTDTWDEDNWLLEWRMELIFKGGDRKDPSNCRPITCLPAITKMITLAIHKRMRDICLETVKDVSWSAIKVESEPHKDARMRSLRLLPRTR